MDASALGPMELFMFFGKPTTNFVTSYSFTNSPNRSKPKFSSSSLMRIISMPCAVQPNKSLTATPTVREPTSSPMILI